MGQEMPHPWGIRLLEQRDLELTDGVVIKAYAHVELDGKSYDISVHHHDELVLRAGEHYMFPDPPYSGPCGPDLNVRLPTGHHPRLRTSGPAEKRVQ